MSVQISNRFALLSAGAPSKQPPPKALKDNKAVSEAKQLVAQEVAKQDRAKQERNVERNAERAGDNKGRGGKSNTRGGRGGGDRGGRGGGAPRERALNADGTPRERKQGDRPFKPRPNKEGEAPVEGKRKFDRRPGTGRPVNEEKKTGHGKGNWGTISDEVTDAEVIDNADGTPNVPKTDGAPVEPVPEEPPTLTLAEYEKLQKENSVKIELPPSRVVVEDDVLKNQYTKLEKKEYVANLPPKSKKNKDKNQSPAPKKQKTVPLTQVLDVRPPPRGNDREGYKGKGRGGPRGPKQEGNRQFAYNEDAFPSLS